MRALRCSLLFLLSLVALAGIASADDLLSSGFGRRDFRDLGDQPVNKIGAIDVSYLIDLASAREAVCSTRAGTYSQGATLVGLAGVKAKLKWEVAGMNCPGADFTDCKKIKRLAKGKVTLSTLGAPNLGDSEVADLHINFDAIEKSLPKGCCPYFLASTKGIGATPVGDLRVNCETEN